MFQADMEDFFDYNGYLSDNQSFDGLQGDGNFDLANNSNILAPYQYQSPFDDPFSQVQGSGARGDTVRSNTIYNGAVYDSAAYDNNVSDGGAGPSSTHISSSPNNGSALFQTTSIQRTPAARPVTSITPMPGMFLFNVDGTLVWCYRCKHNRQPPNIAPSASPATWPLSTPFLQPPSASTPDLPATNSAHSLTPTITKPSRLLAAKAPATNAQAQLAQQAQQITPQIASVSPTATGLNTAQQQLNWTSAHATFNDAYAYLHRPPQVPLRAVAVAGDDWNEIKTSKLHEVCSKLYDAIPVTTITIKPSWDDQRGVHYVERQTAFLNEILTIISDPAQQETVEARVMMLVKSIVSVHEDGMPDSLFTKDKPKDRTNKKTKDEGKDKIKLPKYKPETGMKCSERVRKVITSVASCKYIGKDILQGINLDDLARSPEAYLKQKLQNAGLNGIRWLEKKERQTEGEQNGGTNETLVTRVGGQEEEETETKAPALKKKPGRKPTKKSLPTPSASGSPPSTIPSPPAYNAYDPFSVVAFAGSGAATKSVMSAGGRKRRNFHVTDDESEKGFTAVSSKRAKNGGDDDLEGY